MHSPTPTLNRRVLLSGPLGAAALYALPTPAPASSARPTGTPEQIAHDESFWRQVRAEFELDTNHVRVNLAA